MKNLILTSLIITLLLVSVYTYADDEYESLLQEYMNLNLSEDNKVILIHVNKLTFIYCFDVTCLFYVSEIYSNTTI